MAYIKAARLHLHLTNPLPSTIAPIGANRVAHRSYHFCDASMRPQMNRGDPNQFIAGAVIKETTWANSCVPHTDSSDFS